jgi:hypothetical protein
MRHTDVGGMLMTQPGSVSHAPLRCEACERHAMSDSLAKSQAPGTMELPDILAGADPQHAVTLAFQDAARLRAWLRQRGAAPAPVDDLVTHFHLAPGDAALIVERAMGTPAGVRSLPQTATHRRT